MMAQQCRLAPVPRGNGVCASRSNHRRVNYLLRQQSITEYNIYVYVYNMRDVYVCERGMKEAREAEV